MTEAPERAGRLRDAAIGVALFSFAVTLWTYLIPVYASGHGNHTILAAIAALLIGALALLLTGLAALGVPTESQSASDDDPFLTTGQGREPVRIFVLMAIWGGYVAALPYLGFYIAGAIGLLLSYRLLDIRLVATASLWTAGTLLIVYLVFEHGFRLSLPSGALVVDLLGDRI